MGTIELRKDLHHFIELADDRFLNALHAMMQQYINDADKIVAYSTDGTPLTKEQFVADVEKGYNTYKEGKFKTAAEAWSEIEKWK
jgi:hypothetical protein